MKEKEFARLVKEHRATIYTVCYMFSKDADEVADLFQEVLIRLWKGSDSFRAESSARTWVYRVSLNTCISEERHRPRHERLTLDMTMNLFEDADTETRQIKQLYERINKLQPLDRAIILLWLEQMSYDEIASVMGMTVKNVSVRLVRIKEELKKMSNH